MSNFKFEVGEVVILQSNSRPQHNGEYAIVERAADGECINCPVSGFLIEVEESGTNSYTLDSEYLTETVDGITTALVWHEYALKKKQDPYGESFESMIKEINQMVRPLTPSK